MASVEDKWKKFKEKEDELLHMNEEVDKKRAQLREDIVIDHLTFIIFLYK